MMYSSIAALLYCILITQYTFKLVCANNGVPSMLAEYDSYNFLCSHFTKFCDTILDDLGCSFESGQRSSQGCPGYPSIPNDIANYVGTCSCTTPYPVIAGPTVTKQLIANRIKDEMRWILEPWSSGPPYNYADSYRIICEKALVRLGCSQNDFAITASDSAGSAAFTCACGTLDVTTLYVGDLIMNQVNQYNSDSLPIFENPVQMSRPLSIALIFLVGKLFAILASYLTLPPVLGYICAGVGLQNYLNADFLISGTHEIKTISLIIVLMRAGFSLRVRDFYANRLPTLLLASVPFGCEFAVWLFAGHLFFPGWTLPQMGLFASVVSPVGPSVVINQMLNVVGSKKRDYGSVPKQTLIIAPLEAVLAIVLFGFFQSYNEKENNTMTPWVIAQPMWVNALLLPVNLLFSCFLGVLIGWLNSRYIDWRGEHKPGGGGGYEFLWVRLKKNPQMGSHTADFVYVTLVSAFTMTSLCQPQYIQFANGELVVFVSCITMLFQMRNRQTVQDIGGALRSIWVFAEVILCTLLGTSLAFDQSNGPNISQRALTPYLVINMLQLMCLGIIARFGGIVISVFGVLIHKMPSHRCKWQWLWRYILNVWIYSLPRSTVQATLGSAAWSLRIFPGADGLNKGFVVMQCTAFVVLVFAPIGALLTRKVGFRLSAQLANFDNEVGYVVPKSGKTPLRMRSNTNFKKPRRNSTSSARRLSLNSTEGGVGEWRSPSRSKSAGDASAENVTFNQDDKEKDIEVIHVEVRGDGKGKGGERGGEDTEERCSLPVSESQKGKGNAGKDNTTIINDDTCVVNSGDGVGMDFINNNSNNSDYGSPYSNDTFIYDHENGARDDTVMVMEELLDQHQHEPDDDDDFYLDVEEAEDEDDGDDDENEQEDNLKEETNIFDTWKTIRKHGLTPLRDFARSLTPGIDSNGIGSWGGDRGDVGSDPTHLQSRARRAVSSIGISMMSMPSMAAWLSTPTARAANATTASVGVDVNTSIGTVPLKGPSSASPRLATVSGTGTSTATGTSSVSISDISDGDISLSQGNISRRRSATSPIIRVSAECSFVPPVVSRLDTQLQSVLLDAETLPENENENGDEDDGEGEDEAALLTERASRVRFHSNAEMFAIPDTDTNQGEG